MKNALSIIAFVIGIWPSAAVANAGIPVTGLPSAEGATVAQIRALGDNAWLNLGKPAADPAWGRARGRSWTPKMVFAPDLRAAFLCATGQHGFVKPDGHFMDDLWVYDIHGHRWICAYPGAGTPSSADPLNLHLDSNGFEANSTGEDIPVSYLSHGYNCETYNTDLHLYHITWVQSPWWCNALPQRFVWLNKDSCDYGSTNAAIPCQKHPLFFDAAAGRWDRKFVGGTGPGCNRFEGVLEYIPSLKRAFYLQESKIWFYDYASNAWSTVAATGTPRGYDVVACFDTRRQRIYVGSGTSFQAYDLAGNRWIPLSSSAVGSGVSATLTYDSAGDAVLSNVYDGTPAVRIYDPGTDQWSNAAALPSNNAYNPRMNAFYDPLLNAHFVFAAGDSRDDGEMLVYRYKKSPGNAREIQPRSTVAAGIAISPNPVRNTAVFRMAGALRHTPIRWGIYDMAARRIAMAESNTPVVSWNASGAAPGVYLIRANTGGVEMTKSVVVLK